MIECRPHAGHSPAHLRICCILHHGARGEALQLAAPLRGKHAKPAGGESDGGHRDAELCGQLDLSATLSQQTTVPSGLATVP